MGKGGEEGNPGPLQQKKSNSTLMLLTKKSFCTTHGEPLLKRQKAAKRGGLETEGEPTADTPQK